MGQWGPWGGDTQNGTSSSPRDPPSRGHHQTAQGQVVPGCWPKPIQGCPAEAGRFPHRAGEQLPPRYLQSPPIARPTSTAIWPLISKS